MTAFLIIARSHSHQKKCTHGHFLIAIFQVNNACVVLVMSVRDVGTEVPGVKE